MVFQTAGANKGVEVRSLRLDLILNFLSYAWVAPGLRSTVSLPKRSRSEVSPLSKLSRGANSLLADVPGNGKSTQSVRGRVLVIEDHEDTRFMLRTLLEMDGYLVLEAPDGEAGMELAQQQRPDLILLDYMLPGLDGLDTTRQIRQHKIIRDIPIILLSGRAEPGPRRAALAAGCNEYLVKPVEVDQMMLVIQSYVTGKAESVTA
jgi:two-component system, cell cycle response regulator DivK